jgi:hypothetical protein
MALSSCDDKKLQGEDSRRQQQHNMQHRPHSREPKAETANLHSKNDFISLSHRMHLDLTHNLTLPLPVILLTI